MRPPSRALFVDSCATMGKLIALSFQAHVRVLTMNLSQSINAKTVLFGALLVALAVIALPAQGARGAAPTCPEGERYLRLAKRSGSQQDFVQAVVWLQRSLKACESYDAWHLMGLAQQQQRQFDAALRAYSNAVEAAPDRNSAAISTARYGQVLSLNGQRYEALMTLERALEAHSQPPSWIRTAAKEIDLNIVDEPITRESIKRSLSSQEFGLLAGKKTEPWQAKIGIPINFEFDSVQLDPLTRANLTQLGAVLAEEKYQSKSFTLIGHSDVRGEADYNFALSESRARSIEQALIRQYPSLEGRLKVDGAGETRPKYRGEQTNEDEHRLNRRLEVLVN